MERIRLIFSLFVALLSVLFHLASQVVATSPNITTDQYALLALKAQISYDPHNVLTHNWSTNTSVCNWIGITCGFRHRRVIALNLSYMSLVGTIPPHVGNLSFLVSLSIQNNSFHGSLPNELAHLYRLQILYLSYNQLSGSIPSSIFNINSLQGIDLSNNMLSGMMPSIISNISSLQAIDLSGNRLSGPLPMDTFDNLHNLYWLRLS
jgi:LRR receptor-like serine/threonine-protein kinase FLS2